jgi:hypothetical protein
LVVASSTRFGSAQEAQMPTLLVLERTIPLARVSGRIDHLAVDVQHQRIFVAELGNGSVDAVDLSTGQAHRIEELKEPQGLAYLPDRNELVVASGGDGTVRFFDANSLAPVGSLTLGGDADNVRVDPRNGEVVVGYGSGALAVIDPARRARIRTIPLPAHPEGFEIEDAGRRAIVNLPDVHSIAVVDLERGRVSATLVASHRANFPMSLSQISGSIAVVHRAPPRLVLLDAPSGAVRQDLPTCEDSDDLFFDDKRRRIYVSCGAGQIDIFEQAANGYIPAGHLATRPGARTSLFVPSFDRLYVAAPAGLTGSDGALLVCRPEP